MATDVAAGLDPETSVRATVLAVELARDLGLRGDALRGVYYTTMLRFVGCTSLAAETAEAAGGDDLTTLGDLIVPDAGSPRAMLRAIVTKVGRTVGPLARTAAVARTLANPSFGKQLAIAHCAQAVVRIVHVALRAEIHRRIEGPRAALAVLTARRGGELDGAVVDRFLDGGLARLARVEGSVWDLVLAAEPEPHLRIASAQVARVAEAFARFADLKSPFTLGHSEAVAASAVAAAEIAGMPAVEREQLRIAALLHDLGRVAVPNGIWDKPGPLAAIERERVHDHAAQTGRILARKIVRWRGSEDTAATRAAYRR